MDRAQPAECSNRRLVFYRRSALFPVGVPSNSLVVIIGEPAIHGPNTWSNTREARSLQGLRWSPLCSRRDFTMQQR